MADVSRFSPAKRLWSAAISEGVQLDDEAAVKLFMVSFNARSRAEREFVFGHSLPATSFRTPSGTRARQDLGEPSAQARLSALQVVSPDPRPRPGSAGQ
jgi:hypothetical protein